jgi:hypothetical protein
MFSLGPVLVAAQFLVTLEPKTVRAFDDYVRTVDTQLTTRAANPEPLAGRPAGIFPVNAGLEVKHGLIHDWAAVSFLPGVRLAKAIAVLEDFSHHHSIYPEVVEGRIEKRTDKQIIGFHRLRKKKVLEVKLEARYQLDILPSPENRYASRSVATEIVELDYPETKHERRLTPGHDRGFLWRLQTYWTLEATKEGLWMEVRSISLTRDVPIGLGWAVKPIVRDLPRESLESMMAATGRALLAEK